MFPALSNSYRQSALVVHILVNVFSFTPSLTLSRPTGEGTAIE